MSTLAGTGALTRLALRRDRIMLPAWIYVLVALVASTGYAIKSLYKTALAREQFAASIGHNPALVAVYGSLSGNSVGSLTAWRYGVLAAVGAALMSMFIVIRHTRADEDEGRLELIGSAAVGRHAALATGLLVAVSANVAVAVLVSAGLIAVGLPAGGAIALALAIASCGLVFTAVAAAAAQLAGTARSARGITLSVIGAAYLLRAAGDAAGARGPTWLTWLSPLGWTELVRPFGAIRWWVLVLALAVAAVAGCAAAVLTARRDYGAGLLPPRPGPANGAAYLRTTLALAWRLQRGSLLGWVIGSLLAGVIFGAAAKGIGSLVGSSAQVRAELARLGGQGALTNTYLAAVMGFVGLAAAAYAVSAVQQLHTEESAQRAETVLATAAGRTSWGLSHLTIAAAGTAIVLTAAGLGAGLGYGLRIGDAGGQVGPLLGAALVQLPAALVVAGVAAALFGLAPRACAAGGWIALALAAVLVLLGPVFRLSHWVLDISPFTHLPKLPGATVSATPLAWLVIVAVALGAVGLAGLGRRDIG